MVWFISATLIFTTSKLPKGSKAFLTSLTAGRVALTLTLLVSSSGSSVKPHSMAALSQMAASSSMYSGNGDHSAQPWLPWKSTTSLVSTPRNLTRMGMARTLAEARIWSLISWVISTLLV